MIMVNGNCVLVVELAKCTVKRVAQFRCHLDVASVGMFFNQNLHGIALRAQDSPVDIMTPEVVNLTGEY